MVRRMTLREGLHWIRLNGKETINSRTVGLVCKESVLTKLNIVYGKKKEKQVKYIC